RIGLAGVALLAAGRQVAGWCGGECRVGGLEVVGELLGGAVGVLAEPGVGPGGVVAGLALADGVAVPSRVVPAGVAEQFPVGEQLDRPLEHLEALLVEPGLVAHSGSSSSSRQRAGRA